MNKRLYFILYPLLALLAIFYTSRDTIVTAFDKSVPSQECNFSSTRKTAAHGHTVVLSKDTRERSKNKIRIKANDDYAAIDIPCGFQPAPVNAYASSLNYGEYRTFFFSSPRHSYRLRGPPAA